MKFTKVDRKSLAIWVRSKKHLHDLRKLGYIHYVSKRSDYVIMYVDKDQVDHVLEELQQRSYVKEVKVSALDDMDTDFSQAFFDKFYQKAPPAKETINIDERLHALVETLSGQLKEKEGKK